MIRRIPWLLLLVLLPFSAQPGLAGSGVQVDFNFDQADIRMLVRLVGETTGRRFIVHEGVKGQVTVVSPGPIPVEEIYPLFLSILESRGFTVVERDGSYFVVSIPDHPVALSPPMGGAPGDGGLVTRVYRMANVDVTDVARAVEPLVRGAKNGMLSVFAPSGHLIVTDLESNLRRLETVLAELDREGAARSLEVVALQHASAEDLAEQVSAALSGAGRAGTRVSRHLRQVAEGGASLPADSLVVASAQANSLVLVGTPSQLAELKRLITLLDVEPATGYGRWNAIFLRYLSAEEAAKTLNALLAKSTPKDQAQRIAIEADMSNNALLVDAQPRDFQWIRELVSGLDMMPQQVMIEILIVEVTLDKQLDLGVEWSTVQSPGDGTTLLGRSRPGETDTLMDAVTKGIFPQGLTLGVARGVTAAGIPRVPFLIQALKQDRDVRILSSVPLWAQNNSEASVSVVDNIPILRSTIEGGGGVTRDVIQNIDRVDVGIKLKVTPHVNPDRLITLKLNPSIEAILDPGPADQKFAPTIAKREVSTTVTVADRSTVVISGLIREDRFKKEGKIPLLGDIPFLGALFRYTTDQKRRSNLLIFVTPSLVTTAEEAAEFRATLEQRTELSVPVTVPPAQEK
ncbi:MAG: secretin N-terminal domain-containing protein [Kiritimatiellia bacterium]|nr:secretin N-terminal domain-containing protein [Kiritimatiellia bacterium]